MATKVWTVAISTGDAITFEDPDDALAFADAATKASGQIGYIPYGSHTTEKDVNRLGSIIIKEIELVEPVEESDDE